jgi:hypothetical protein
MPKITSFDVGIKNLAYCILRVDDYNPDQPSPTVDDICGWDVLTVNEGSNVPNTCQNLIGLLDQNPQLSDSDYIVIENQPVTKNPKMKTIQVVILSYYLIQKNLPGSKIKNVFLLNSSHKLKVYTGPSITVTGKTPYTRRKKLSIEYTKYFLNQSEKWLSVLQNHRKKDDLSDSYLQALYIWKNLQKLI